MSKFLKYMVGGTLVYWLEICLTVAVTELTHIWFMHAFLVSLGVGLVLLFFYHKYLTFECHFHKSHQFLSFLFVTLLLYAGWYLVSYILHLYLSAHYLLVVIFSSAPFSLLGYLVNKNIIFKNKEYYHSIKKEIKE